jgi:NAD(P)-dependent dehydrogenase (short-subunit alcohol dehydrogenase family)
MTLAPRPVEFPSRVVVTGASSGLGRAVAERLVARGARVALWARRGDELEAIAEDLGANAVAVVCDVSDPAAVTASAETSEQRLGGLVDGLVNAAGLADPRPLAELDATAWQRMIGVNLSGTFFPSQAIGRRLRTQGQPGSIVNIGSELGAMGMASYAAYCASKAGVIGLTKALAAELAPDIRVNALCPGPIDTPMLRGELALAADFDQALREENSRPPLGRVAQPGEIADAVIWLLAEATFATGSVVPIDGGTTVIAGPLVQPDLAGASA